MLRGRRGLRLGRLAGGFRGALLGELAGASAASKLRAEALAEFLAGWESEHGVLTAEEIARAEAELGLAANGTAV